MGWHQCWFIFIYASSEFSSSSLLSFKFGLLLKNHLMPYHSWLRLLPGNDAYFSPLFFCCWQITDCCAFAVLELSISACVATIHTNVHSQTPYLLFSLCTSEVLSDLSSFFYNCVHILDLVICYFLYKNMGIAKSENKQWFIKPTSLSKRAKKAHTIPRQEYSII